MGFLGASFRTHMPGGSSGTSEQSGSSFGVQETSIAQFLGAAVLLKQAEQLMEKAKTEKTIIRKKLKNSTNFFRQNRQNSQHNTIILLLWMQRHIVIALNFWGDAVVHMIFWLFCKSNHQRIPKLVPVSNLRLTKYMFHV